MADGNLQPSLVAVEGVGPEVEFDVEEAAADVDGNRGHGGSDRVPAGFGIAKRELEVGRPVDQVLALLDAALVDKGRAGGCLRMTGDCRKQTNEQRDGQ